MLIVKCSEHANRDAGFTLNLSDGQLPTNLDRLHGDL